MGLRTEEQPVALPQYRFVLLFYVILSTGFSGHLW